MGTSASPGPGRAPSSPIPAWRAGAGLLVHRGPHRSVRIDELLAGAGQGGPAAASYVLVDGDGRIVDTVSVTTWSVPGERGAAFHIVEGGCLLKVTVRELAGGAPVVCTAAVLAGLEAVPPGDAVAQARAAAALRTDIEPTVVLMSSPSRSSR